MLLDKALMAFASVSLSLIAKLFLHTNKTEVEMPEEGSIIYCNHTSDLDFISLLYALYPRRDVRFVVSDVQYDKSRLRKWLFKHLGIIRKQQGTHDLVCVKKIIKNVRAGKVVVIYAAGMTSYDGRQAWDVLPGSANLGKMLKCPVYVALIHGGFLNRPRHASKLYRGRLDISVKRLFSSEEIALLPIAEAEKRLNDAMRFNDWDWQEKEKVIFRGLGLTGANLPLYRCPACGAEGRMKADKHGISCPDCGFSAKTDALGFFVSGDPACPRRMDAWVDAEISELKKEIGQDGFRLSAPVTLMRKTEKSKYLPACKGVLTMDKEGVRFDGETPVELAFKEFQFFVLGDGKFLQINTSETAFRFAFDDGALVTKWFFAHRLLCGIEA